MKYESWCLGKPKGLSGGDVLLKMTFTNQINEKLKLYLWLHLQGSKPSLFSAPGSGSSLVPALYVLNPLISILAYVLLPIINDAFWPALSKLTRLNIKY